MFLEVPISVNFISVDFFDWICENKTNCNISVELLFFILASIGALGFFTESPAPTERVKVQPHLKALKGRQEIKI
jgi:hypothetical protein